MTETTPADDAPAPQTALPLLAERTQGLLETIRGYDDAAVAEPSLLPGWTRGHLLTHLARNADALVNLCTWARTGVATPMYPSAERRTADIEAGAGRTADELLADVEAGAAALAAALDSLRDDQWSAEVRHGGHDITKPASWIPMMRLGEVELHRVDLGADHPPQRWPAVWVNGALPDAVRDLDERAGEPLALRASDTDRVHGTTGGRTVTGTAAELLAWATGRSEGSALGVEPPGELPQLGAWR